MKTAVSIPDRLFQQCDRLARKLRKSRSRLYSIALAEFVARHTGDEVTEAMDRVLETLGESERGPDPAIQAASVRALRKVEW